MEVGASGRPSLMHLLAALFLGFLVSKGQGTDKIVSATVPAAPAPRAIAELSKQVGFPLSAMPSVKNDVIVIQVQKVRLQDLMDKIAATAHAGWEKDENGYRLVRTDAMRRAERESEWAKDAELFRKPLEEIRKAVAAYRGFDAQKELPTSPAARALDRLVAAFKPEDLAGIPFQKRVIYSSSPTKMELPLPGNAANVLDKFKEEWNSLGNPIGNGGLATKLLITASRNYSGTAIDMLLHAVAPDGNIVGGAFKTIGIPADQAWKDAPKVSSSEEPIKLSPISESFYTISQNVRLRESKPVPPIPAELRNQLLRPDLYDPLSFVPSEIILGAAKAKNLNVVGVLPDLMINNWGWIPGVSLPSVALKEVTSARWGGVIEDGWLTISPPNASVGRALRLDRVALATALAAAKRESGVSLDIAAAFARKNEDPNSMQVLALWRWLGSDPENIPPFSWYPLKFYGSLSASQWQAINAGQPIPFRSFTPEQRELLETMIYSGYGMLSLSPGATSDAIDAFFNNAKRLPSESFPNGVPGDGFLETKVERESVVFVDHPVAKDVNYTPEELAFQIAARERKDLFKWLDTPHWSGFKFDKFQVGERIDVNFRFRFTPELELQGSVSGNRRQTGRWVPLSGLSKEFRDTFEQQLAKFREQNKNAKPPG